MDDESIKPPKEQVRCESELVKPKEIATQQHDEGHKAKRKKADPNRTNSHRNPR